MLECVINVSEGRRQDVVDLLGSAAGKSLLDVHSDVHHNRSVFTLAGPSVEQDARELTSASVASLDIREHYGVHPRIGVVDVVPFVPLEGSGMDEATSARDSFAKWAADELNVPVFLYGAHRSLPQLRREAFTVTPPDFGPAEPHETAGAIAAGVREALVAYNLWLDSDDRELARQIAAEIRSDEVRTLGLSVGEHAQVSCNLLAPATVGPDAVYDAVAARANIFRAELVGLMPHDALERVPQNRWEQLDLSPDRTIEARLRAH